MKNIQTANQLSGMAIGSIFAAVFGAIWLALSLYALEQLRAATVCGVLLGLAVLVLAARHLLREAKRWPRVPDDPALRRVFMWVNAVQWIAVFVVAFTLARLRLDAYIMNAITAIVGLHMFPLARLFRYPPHYATGAVLVAWAVFSVFLVPVERLQGVTSLGTGAILWFSAAVTLTLA
jgi:MFS family permease